MQLAAAGHAVRLIEAEADRAPTRDGYVAVQRCLLGLAYRQAEQAGDRRQRRRAAAQRVVVSGEKGRSVVYRRGAAPIFEYQRSGDIWTDDPKAGRCLLDRRR
jgi:hypothetical protein